MVERQSERFELLLFLAISAVSLAVFRHDNEDSGDRRIEKVGIWLFWSTEQRYFFKN